MPGSAAAVEGWVEMRANAADTLGVHKLLVPFFSVVQLIIDRRPDPASENRSQCIKTVVLYEPRLAGLEAT
jgi:hypothetical protein